MANDYARTVADTLIEQLRQGTAPWQKPWDATGTRFMPYNPTSGKDYRGMNAMWLWMQGHEDSRWMTYKQAAGEGGQVRKGEKGTQVQYWKFDDRVAAKDANGKPIKDGEGKPVMVAVKLERPRIFSATVFNASQIDGLPPPELRPQPEAWEREQRAEAILSNSRADIRHQAGDRAYYMPSLDHIVLPERGQFADSADYYGTALHELGHWTGHKSRLDRDLAHPFGSAGYAKEELRAEISSLMMADRLGIPHKPDRHAAYVGNWIKALEDDPREIFRAAAEAEKITGMLQGFEQQQAQTLEPAISATGEATELVAAPNLTDPNEVAMKERSDRVYLAVPYAEKNEAKALGAKWDGEAKSWFAPIGVDLAPLERWNRPAEGQAHTDQDPRIEFKDALKDAGLIVEGLPQMDGQMVRVKVEGDKGAERSGTYVGHSDAHPAGYINNFRTGHEGPWRASSRHAKALTGQERGRLAAEAAATRAQRERERERGYGDVAQAIGAHWANATPATSDHPYLARKDVEAYGVRVDPVGKLALPPGAAPEDQQSFSRPGSLLVPLTDMDGQLWSVQAIDPSGFKSLAKGGRYSGLHHMIGDIGTSGPIIVAEGYATGAELHRETGLPIAVAFSSSNIEAVAVGLRDRHPERPLVIAGDNDHRKPLEMDAQGRPKPNVGKEKSEAAALAVGGVAMLPAFDAADQGTDWNDLRRDKGQGVFAAQVRAGLAVAQRHQLAHDKRASRLAPGVELGDDRQQKREKVAAIAGDEGRSAPRRARSR